MISGIGGAESWSDWGALLTQEYVDPNNLDPNSYKQWPLDPGLTKEAKYQETGSYTWKVSYGVPFAIAFPAWGKYVNLDATVASTQGTTNWVYYLVDRRGDTNPNTLYFRVYTAGTFYNSDQEIGGMELHIWDMSGAG